MKRFTCNDLTRNCYPRIIDNLDEISESDALRVALWLLGEYADTIDVGSNATMIVDAFNAIKGLLGEPPFTSTKDDGDHKPEEVVSTTVTKNIVLADGTYASVTSTETTGGPQNDESIPHLRRLLCAGDILLGNPHISQLEPKPDTT